MNCNKIIIDCDPGTDDAIALALASVLMKSRIIGMISSYGNTVLSNTHRNLVDIAGLLNIDCTIFYGSAHPIDKPEFTVTDYHGNNGLCGIKLHSDVKLSENEIPFDRVYDLIRKNKKVVYIATGPLTNLATLITNHPDITDMIEKVVIMGGGLNIGNTPCGAEYNFSLDSIANNIVLKASVEKVLITLDLTHTLSLSEPEIDKLVGPNRFDDSDNMSPYRVMAEIMYRNLFSSLAHGNDGAIIHDAATIAFLKAPEKCTICEIPLKCDANGCLSISEDGSMVKLVESLDKSYLMSTFKKVFAKLNT